jgi:site-specific DNA-methyltransferase (adenine-specific)
MLNQIIQGDCYELMKGIPDGSIDLVLTDPPYNTIAADWDKQPIDLVGLWVELKRVAKSQAAFVFTATQPFTTDLINSNREWFKYCWVWDKHFPGSFANCNKQPMKSHEDIVVFMNCGLFYHPQMMRRLTPIKLGGKKVSISARMTSPRPNEKTYFEKYPLTLISISSRTDERGFHPTQKPVNLFGYLIKTYSNPGETILDPFAGSGTTALAAHATGRNFICMEREQKYCEIANKRLALAQMQGRFEEMVG